MSAFLLAIGTYFSTLEVPIWVGSEADLMHIYTLFISFPLWIAAGVLLVLGVAPVLSKPMNSLRPGKPFMPVETKVSIAFGVLVLASVFFAMG
jgi:hypothetical protein